MKRKFLAFPLLALALSPTVMAGQFIWTGGTDSAWTNPANWDITSSVPVSPDTYPIPGTTYASDFLNIRNNGDLTIDPPGTTPGADAVYNPGAGITTTFNGGRCFVIGTGTGPDAILPNLPNRKGYAKLTVSSGTIVGARTTNGGSEAYMANRADTTLLINGGNVDLSAHLNNFRLIQEGFADTNGPITSTITIDSGSLSCRSLDLVFDQEADPSTVFGTGVINLNGGTFNMLRFVRTAASDPGQTSFTFNLNGGTLRPLLARTDFLGALTDLKTVVKAGGAIITTTTPAAPNTPLDLTIAAVLEHDTSGPAIDGGLTKNGPGTLTLSGANTFTGPVTVNAGTALATTFSRLTLDNDSAAGTGSITLADSYAELRLFGTTGRTIANPLVISNTGDEKSLIFTQTGTATISGPITINETNSDHFRVRTDNSALNLTGKISGPGGIYRYAGGNTVSLTNSENDFTGGARITVGTLQFSAGALGTSGAITMDGGTLRWVPGNGNDLSTRLTMVDGKNAILSTGDESTFVTFANPIGNGSTATLVKQGNGWLTLQQPSNYTGGTTVTAGIFNAFAGGFGPSGNITMNGGILRWAAGNTEDISSRLVLVNDKAAKLAVASASDSVAFANGIGGGTSASLEKQGSGILTLNGTNSYTGTTIVTGGTLLVNGSLNAASAVTVNGGNLGGTGTIGGSVTVAAAGSLAPGASAGTLTISGNLDISAMSAGTGKLKFELDALAGINDLIAVGGALALGDLAIDDLEITNLGSLQVETYTLITSTFLSGTVNGTPDEIAPGFDGQLLISGNNLQLVVTEAVSDPYIVWSGGAAFNVDTNNDGVDNGLAWFLGAPDKDANANGLLPETTQSAGALVLEFNCLNAADRGTATFAVQYSSDLGQLDTWAETEVPGAVGTFTAGVVDFEVTDPGEPGGLLKVVASIPVGEAAAGKLFARVVGQP